MRDGTDQIMFLAGLMGFGILVFDRIWPQENAFWGMGMFFALVAYLQFYSQTDPKRR